MIEGFFNVNELKSKYRPDGKNYTCQSCGLIGRVLSPKMGPHGDFKMGILNIGEAPGEVEDRRGMQWQGKTGRYLKETYRELGIDLFEDCLNINAVNCRPTSKTGNRPPTNYEIDCCRKSVIQLIEKYKPKVVVLFGGAALYSIIGHRWKKKLDGINKWRGFTIPDQDFKTWICPVFHPSYVLRNDTNSAVETIWKQDLQRAISMVDVELPKYIEPKIHYIEDLSVLKTIHPPQRISFDYETTGLKPHGKGHRIICASVAISENEGYSFMMPKKKSERKPFIDLLLNEGIYKIAHNMKFEESWSLVRLGTRVKGWEWDSMVAAHLLDNRTGITSLKFQVFVNFGIPDYDSEVSKYLMAKDPKNGNSMNTIKDLISTKSGERKLLKYCGLDSIYEYRLAEKQQCTECFLPF